jgi:hypothetical protein
MWEGMLMIMRGKCLAHISDAIVAGVWRCSMIVSTYYA